MPREAGVFFSFRARYIAVIPRILNEWAPTAARPAATVTEAVSVRKHAALAAAVAALVVTACGPSSVSVSSLRSYLAAVEPVRLGVNRLLENADPVIAGYRDHHLSGEQGATVMGRLEQSFARYMVEINGLQPSDAMLAAINAPYAHTYILEDAYLNALASGLSNGDLSSLPDTQSEQRDAIIEWRVQLELLAQQLSLALPADLQQAGRGEMAPSVSGSS